MTEEKLLEGVLVEEKGKLYVRSAISCSSLGSLSPDHGLGHVLGERVSICRSGDVLIIQDAQGNELYRGEGCIRTQLWAQQERDLTEYFAKLNIPSGD